jgi:hypothetical protein
MKNWAFRKNHVKFIPVPLIFLSVLLMQLIIILYAAWKKRSLNIQA